MGAKKNGRDYGGEVIDGAIGELTGGVNLKVGENAINNALQALECQTKVLIKAKYDPSKPELVARSAAHTAKVIDETMRLIAFSKGGPDSRLGLESEALKLDAMQELLSGLTDEQFRTFRGWLGWVTGNEEQEASDQSNG